MRMGGRPGAPRALAVPTGPLGSAGPPQTAKTIFSCILERLIENRLKCLQVSRKCLLSLSQVSCKVPRKCLASVSQVSRKRVSQVSDVARMHRGD